MRTPRLPGHRPERRLQVFLAVVGRAATAPVRAWRRRAATATAWLDVCGDIAAPPPARDFAATAGAAAGCATAFGGVATACGVRWALGRSIDRRRLAQWARAWERVEAGWVTRYTR
ncbi:hypothetical protein ACFXDH_18490 [Streptomyces sp. NPDC059467]|uniref:hypothetical protein n=1 Tax=Streptomyces sp. NPDC059467 TaxID=3346844 RepID=UPI00368A6ECB